MKVDFLFLTRRLRLSGLAESIGSPAGASITTVAALSRVDALVLVGNSATRPFLSVEPQWEMLRLGHRLKGVDWVIQGGESGSVDRFFDTSSAISLRNECARARVPYTS